MARVFLGLMTGGVLVAEGGCASLACFLAWLHLDLAGSRGRERSPSDRPWRVLQPPREAVEGYYNYIHTPRRFLRGVAGGKHDS